MSQYEFIDSRKNVPAKRKKNQNYFKVSMKIILCMDEHQNRTPRNLTGFEKKLSYSKNS